MSLIVCGYFVPGDRYFRRAKGDYLEPLADSDARRCLLEQLSQPILPWF
ncbi:MAG: hypothetical protein R3C99_00425 [Pirellulaceae bacterium]|nr:hypothetical protein [Planctomycetales bacterium]